MCLCASAVLIVGVHPFTEKGSPWVWRGFLVVQDAALALKRSQRTGDLKADEGQVRRARGLQYRTVR